MDLLGFLNHPLPDFAEIRSLGGQFGEAALHALDGPEEIDGGGAGFCERVADLREFGAESFHGFRGSMQNAEGSAHGRSNADGRSATNDHFTDGFSDFAIVGVGVGDFLGGKAALVDDDHAAISPCDGLG